MYICCCVVELETSHPDSGSECCCVKLLCDEGEEGKERVRLCVVCVRVKYLSLLVVVVVVTL